MNNYDELVHLLALKRAPLLGDITIKKLVRTCGSAVNVWKEKPRSLTAIEGIGELKTGFLKDESLIAAAEAEVAFAESQHYNIITYLDDTYPTRLSYCADGPVVIFTRGNINFEQTCTLSIVGTRQVTSYGEAFLEKLMHELAPMNPLIVSGYAYGVDIIAHKLALELGLQTVGVMAHGLNITYPKTHAAYNNAVMAHGGFVTDFWHTDAFDRKNFLGRNRIIAGLTEATVVIESADKGGSLVTAEMANGYNREVFALPGRLSDKYSVGCNMLIKTNQAQLLTGARDIAYVLGWDERKVAVQKQLFVELTEPEKEVYRYLKSHGRDQLDLIALGLSKPVHTVASLLMSMELKGVVRPLPGKQFELA